MIAAGQLVTRDPIPVRTVYHHQPSLLAQFDRHVNRANMANDGCANVGCMHLTSPMVRVWKPKPIGCTPIAPWHLRMYVVSGPYALETWTSRSRRPSASPESRDLV